MHSLRIETPISFEALKCGSALNYLG